MRDPTTSDDQRADGDPTRQRDGPRTTPQETGELTRRRFVRSSAAAGAGALALGGASTAAGQNTVEESCLKEAEVLEVGEGGHWHLLNDPWGMEDSEQCIWVNEDGSYGYDFSAVGDGINYPEVFCGGRPWGEHSGIPELPARRGDVDELELAWDVDVDVSGGQWNLATEWWLVDGEIGEDPDLAREVILSLDWGGGLDRDVDEANVLTDQFGNTVDYWGRYPTGSASQGYHLFRIAGGGAASGRVDLTALVEFMSERNGISDDLTLAGVEVGTEYWEGAEGEVTYEQLDLTVNGALYRSGSDEDGHVCDFTGADRETLEDGSMVCDLDGDGNYRDVNGDAAVSNGDVTDFFANQHVDPWNSRTDLFDFTGDGDVGQGDVVELFSSVN